MIRWSCGRTVGAVRRAMPRTVLGGGHHRAIDTRARPRVQRSVASTEGPAVARAENRKRGVGTVVRGALGVVGNSLTACCWCRRGNGCRAECWRRRGHRCAWCCSRHCNRRRCRKCRRGGACWCSCWELCAKLWAVARAGLCKEALTVHPGTKRVVVWYAMTRCGRG